MNPEYVRELEETIRKFLNPLRDIPFSVVIKSLTGCEVLPFDAQDEGNAAFLQKLERAAHSAGVEAHRRGIRTNRPNEAGNRIEPYVLEALSDQGLPAERPRAKSGKRKAAGYPDLELKDPSGKVAYLDCKTYAAKSRGQTFRTFYLSPSDDPKITTDAFHLLLSFELEEMTDAGQRVFVPVSWHLYTLHRLRLQLKYEFNANNRELYIPEALLAEGTF